MTTRRVCSFIAALSWLGVILKLLLGAGVHQHRCGAGEQHHVGIGHPVGCRDDHLVAGVEHRLGQVEEALLAAAGDQDLLRRIVQAVVALELGDDGALEFRRAVHGGVLGEAVADGGDGGLFDVIRGVEVRLAGAKADHVLAGGAQLLGAGGDGEGRRRLDGLHAGGKLDGHRCSVGLIGAESLGRFRVARDATRTRNG
jgi:hypothetical protein